jgi:hypothetical protein
MGLYAVRLVWNVLPPVQKSLSLDIFGIMMLTDLVQLHSFSLKKSLPDNIVVCTFQITAKLNKIRSFCILYQKAKHTEKLE